MKKIFFIPLITIVFLILFLVMFQKLFLLYFQGDEWYHFRVYRPFVNSFWWPVSGIVYTFTHPQQFGFHLSPLLDLIYVWTFHIFGLNQYPYLYLYAIIHLINTCLLYHLIKNLTRSKIIAIFSAFFFLLTASHQEAFSWISAAPGTTISVTFILLSLSFFLKFTRSDSKKYLHLCFLFTFLGLITKETAFTLIPALIFFYIICKKPSFLEFIKGLWGIWLSIGVFILIRLFFSAPAESLHPDLFLQGLITKISLSNLDLFAFRYVALTLKTFSQSFVHQEIIKALAVFLTDYQFPFFAAEKPIYSMMYIQLIQGPLPEILSYMFSAILLLIFAILRIPKKWFLVSLVWFLSGVIPILGVTLIFPWWGYTASIDSRHFYHLSIATSLLFGVAIYQIYKKIHRHQLLIICLLLIGWAWWQSGFIDYVLSQQEIHAKQRKLIISSMQKSIGTPPKKMIIYTQSNRNYYGFNLLMLPFQTAFSQMIPLTFGKTYNPKGLSYPANFYSAEFIGSQGLASQGYEEEGDYGIGYFLTLTPVVKVLEAHDYSPDMVFSFFYDGDKIVLDDKTAETRKELTKILESRMIFRNWKTFDRWDRSFRFRFPPSSNVTTKNETFLVTDADKEILSITVTANPTNAGFDGWLSEQVINGEKIGLNYIRSEIKPDLALNRTKFIVKSSPNIFYVVAGTFLEFYKIEVFDQSKADLIIRTLEFKD